MTDALGIRLLEADLVLTMPVCSLPRTLVGENEIHSFRLIRSCKTVDRGANSHNSNCFAVNGSSMLFQTLDCQLLALTVVGVLLVKTGAHFWRVSSFLISVFIAILVSF